MLRLSPLASLCRCLASRTRPQPRALARFLLLAPLRPAPLPAPLLMPWRRCNGSACNPSILWFATSRCCCYGGVGVVWLLVRCCCAGLPIILDAGRTACPTQPRRRLHGNCDVSYLSLTLWLYTLLDANRWLMLVTLYWCCCSGAIYLSNWSSSSGLCDC
jgi:hypothetical protein